MQSLLLKEPLFHATIAGYKTETRRTHGLDMINKAPDKYRLLTPHEHYDFIRSLPSHQQTRRITAPDQYYFFRHIETGVITDVRARFNTGQVLFLAEPVWVNKPTDHTVYYGYDHPSDKHPLYDKTFRELGYRKVKMMMKAIWARHFVLITSASIQRLHDITEEDAIAEGIRWNKGTVQSGYGINGDTAHLTAKNCFQSLWQQINSPDSWASNPYVFRYKYMNYRTDQKAFVRKIETLQKKPL